MLNWTKTVRGNYISSFDYQNIKYRLQVYTNGVYKIVEIAYKINIVGRIEPYNKIIAQGFCNDLFTSMNLAEKNLKRILHIRDDVKTIFEKPEEKIELKVEEEKIEKFKKTNPELYEEVKEDLEEKNKPICNEPIIGLVTTELGTYVTISGDPEDEVRFTINNKAVTSSSKLYRKPFLLKDGMIIKTKAFNKEKKASKQIRYMAAKEK